MSKNMNNQDVYMQIEEQYVEKINCLDQFFSLMMTIYQYIIYFPSIISCFNYLNNNVFAQALLIITILLNLITSDTDYNYEIKLKDYLARPFTIIDFSYKSFIEVFILAAITQISQGQSALLASYLLINGLNSYFFAYFYDKYAQLLNIFTHIFLFGTSITYQIQISYIITNQLLGYLFLIYIPFSYKIASLIVQRDYLNLEYSFQQLDEKNKQNHKNIDKIIRMSIFDDIESSKQNEKKYLKFLNLIIDNNISKQNKVINPIKESNYTNQNILSEYQEKNLSDGQDKIKFYIKSQQNLLLEDVSQLKQIEKKIIQLLKDYFINISNNQLRSKENKIQILLSLLAFLIEISESYRIFFLMYLQLSKSQDLSLKFKQILNSIHQIFLKKRSVVRKRLGRANPFNCSYLQVIIFENKLEKSYSLLHLTINLKLQILATMKQRNIIATQLITKIETMQKQIQQLKKNLNYLVKLNSESLDLLNLQALFLENLSFSEKDINLVQINKFKRKKNFQQTKYINHQSEDEILSSLNQDQFDEKSCVIFASYSDSKSMTINQVSSSFSNLFCFTKNEHAKGLAIESIIPQAFQTFHNKYIKQYLEQSISTDFYQSKIEQQQDYDQYLNEVQNEIIPFNQDQHFQNQSKHLINNYSGKDSQTFQVKNCKMNQQIIFASLNKMFVLPVKIDIKTNEYKENETFGLVAKVKQINQQYQYILFDEKELSVIGLTQYIHEILFPNCSNLQQIKLGQIFPFLTGIQNKKINKALTEQNQEMIHNIDDAKYQFNVNSTDSMQDFLKDQQKSKLSYIVINGETINTKPNTSLQITKQQSKAKSFKDISSYYFTYVELFVKKIKYKGVVSVSYLEIINIKQLNPESQAQQILQEITSIKKKDIYSKMFENSYEFQNIISDLEQNINIYGYSQSNHIDSEFRSYYKYKNQNQQHLLIKEGNNHINFSQTDFQKSQQLNAKQITLGDESTNFEQIKLKQNRNEYDDCNYQSDESSRQYFKQLREQKISHKQLQNYITSEQTLTQLIEENQINIQDLHLKINFESKNTIFQNLQLQELNGNSNYELCINNQNNQIFQQIDFQSDQNLNSEQIKSVEQILYQPKEKCQQGMLRCIDQINLKQQNESNITQNINQNNKIIESTKFSQCKNSNIQIKERKRKANRQFTKNSYSNSQTFSLNNDKNTKKKVHDFIYDIASSNSQNSYFTPSKSKLYQIMADRSTLNVIKIINIIGIICFSAMMYITWYQFNSMQTFMTLSNQDYEDFSWPTTYSSSLSDILKYKNIQQLTNYTRLNFTNMEERQDFYNQMQTKAQDTFQEVLILLNYMEKANTAREVFNKVIEYKTNYFFGSLYNQTQLNQIPSNTVDLVTVNHTTNLQNSMVLTIQNIFRYINNQGSGRAEYLLIQNQLEQISQLQILQDDIKNTQLEQQEYFNKQLSIIIVILIVINTSCVGIIIPLYYYIQKERDSIIQLFTTFSVSKLDDLIKKIQNSVQSINTLSSQQKQKDQIIINAAQVNENEKNMKKQSISSITSLPSYNKKLIFACLIIFSLIMCYPITVRILTKEYLQKSALDLETISKVQQLRSYLLQNTAMHFNILVMKARPNLKPMKPEIYYGYLQSLIEKQEDISNDIQWIIKSQYSNKRFNQDLYDSFFFSAFKTNLCDNFKKFPQFNTDPQNINVDLCDSPQNVFLQQGFQVAYKSLFPIFTELYNMYIIKEEWQSRQQIRQYLQRLDAQQFTAFTEFLGDTIFSLNQFIINQNDTFYHQIEIKLIALISFQMEIRDEDYHPSYLKHSRFYFLYNEEFMNTLIQILLFINGMLLLYMVFGFIRFMYLKFRMNKKRNNREIYMKIEEYLVENSSCLDQFFSLMMTIYQYIIYFPSLILCFNDLQNNTASQALLSTTILLNIITSDTDYNYEIKLKDYLAKPFTILDFSFKTIIEIFSFAALTYIPQSQSAVLACYLLISGLNSYFFAYFYDNYSQLLNIFTHIFLFGSSVTYQIYIQYNIDNQLQGYLILVYIPFSYKIASLIVERDNLNLQSSFQLFNEKNNINLQKLDRIIRMSIFDHIESSKQNEKKYLKFLNLITNKTISNHNKLSNSKKELNDNLINQSLESKQSDEQNQPKILAKSQQNLLFEDISQLKQIEKLVIQQLRDQLIEISNKKQKNKTQSLLSLFIFLIEVSESYRIYFLMYLQFTKSKNLSLKQKQILNSIHQIFLKRRYVIRKQMGKANPFDCSYLQVIIFENKLEQSYSLFNFAINLKLQILTMMKQRNIIATKFIAKIEAMQKQIQLLKKNLNYLVKINNESLDLLNLQAMFLENLSFSQKDINLLKINKFSRQKNFIIHQNEDKILSSFFNQTEFDEKSCVIFASYQDQKSMIINQVSSNFSNLFCYQKNEHVKGQSIESIIPQAFQNIHNLFIKQYLEESISIDIYQSNLEQQQDYQQYLQENQNNDNKIISFDLDNNYQFTQPKYLQKKFSKADCQNLMLKSSKMNKQIIFASLNKMFVLPVKIDIKTNEYKENDAFGLVAKLKQINEEYQYILFNDTDLSVIGLTKNMHEIFFPNCSNLQQIKLGQIFPFLISTQNKAQNQESPDYNFEMTYDSNYKKCYFHENFKENIQKTLKQQQKNKFSYIIINKETVNTTKSSSLQIIKQLIQTKSLKQISSYSFIYVELFVKKLKYKGVENVSCIEIVKTRQINPESQAPIILQEITNIKKNYIYYQMFENLEELQKIISDLEQNINIHNHSQFNNDHNELNSKNYNCNQQQQHIKERNNYINFLQTDFQKSQQVLLKQLTLGDESTNLDQIKIMSDRIQNEIFNYQSDESSSQTIKQLSENRVCQNYNENLQFNQPNKLQNNIESKQKLIQLTQENQVKKEDQNLKIDFAFNLQNTQRNLQNESYNYEHNHQIQDNSLQFNNQNNQQFQSFEILSDQNLNGGQIKYVENIQNKPNEKVLDIQNCLELMNLKQSSENNHLKNQHQNSKVLQSNNFTKNNIDHSQAKAQNNKVKKQFINSSDTDSQNNSIFQDKNNLKRVHDIISDIALSSSQGSYFTPLKSKLHQIMADKSTLKVIKVINIIGIICFYVMIYITWFQFDSMQYYMALSNQDYEDFSWPTTYSSSLSDILKYKNIQQLLDFTRQNFTNITQRQNFYNEMQIKAQGSLSDVLSSLNKMEQANTKRNLFNKVIDCKTIYYFDQLYNKTFLSQTPSYITNLITYNYTTNLQYSMVLTMQGIYHYINNLGNGRAEYLLIKNQLEQIYQLKNLQDDIQKDQQEQQKYFNKQLFIIIIILIVINTIQKQIKKQSISSITSLPKYNKKLIFACLLIFSLITCYPITVRILTKDYLIKSALDFETISKVQYLRSYLLQNIAMHLNILVMKARPRLKPMEAEIYYDYLKSLIEKQEHVSNDIQWILTSQYSDKRFNQDLYNSFFFSAFKTNLCDLFKKFPQFNINPQNINIQQCDYPQQINQIECLDSCLNGINVTNLLFRMGKLQQLFE
ncbi:hypothetical protein ABPG74_000529 [Tetrahymena malaccensis]